MNINIKNSWNDILKNFRPERKDVYYLEEYVNLYKGQGGTPKCAVCMEDGKILLMPFISREIRGFYDFEIPYGYGGEIANTEDIEWTNQALQELHRYFKEERYICGFIRFHPLLGNAENYMKWYTQEEDVTGRERYREGRQIIYDRPTVAIDTSQCVDEMWETQINSKNRNMIRKAEKNGLKYRTEFDFESMDEFINLYEETMRRLGADSFYFFDNQYFKEFVSNMKGRAFLGTVRKDGKMICAALFMYSDCYGHYHLEGSDHSNSGLGANNYLLWKVACEMHDMGVKEFHLGGGNSSSPENSLFKFKKVFSNNVKDFYIGKEIFNAPVYTDLCNEWERQNIDRVQIYGNRLLKYRC